MRFSTEHKPVSAKDLAAGLPKEAWRRMTWRQGTNAPLASRFAAVRVRPAHCSELKREIGLGPYEDRGWRRFHHQASLCIAAYGVLVAERAAFSPSAERGTPLLQAPAVPEADRPRGAADPA